MHPPDSPTALGMANGIDWSAHLPRASAKLQLMK